MNCAENIVSSDDEYQDVVDFCNDESDQRNNNYYVHNTELAKFYDIYLYGVGVVISGHISGWNSGLTFGFWEFFISTTIVTTGYVFLCLCLAELTSALSFSGGVYGFARVSLGPYLGYLVGMGESFKFVYYTSSAVFLTSSLFNTIFSISDNMLPFVWLMFYIICLLVHLRGGRLVYRVSSVIVMITVILIILFCTSTIPNMHFQTYAAPIGRLNSPFLTGGISGFLLNFPISAWLYIGIEAVPLIGSDTIDQSNNIPKAMMLSLSTLIFLTYAIIFAVSSQYPGLITTDDQNNLSTAKLPFSYGFSSSFHISMNVASLFSLPGLFMGIYGSMTAFGKQMLSVAQSGLFPIQFTYTYGENNVPYFALIFGCLAGYIVMIFFWFFDQGAFSVLRNICNLCTFSVYIVLFLCYIVFAYKYDHLDRPFRNPLGIASAVMGLVIFLFLNVSVAFFQQDNYYALISFGSYIGIMSIYYYFIASKRQCFSPEEEKVMLKIYVLKSNRKTRLKINARRSSETSTTIRSQIRAAFGSNSKVNPFDPNPFSWSYHSSPVNSNRISVSKSSVNSTSRQVFVTNSPDTNNDSGSKSVSNSLRISRPYRKSFDSINYVTLDLLLEHESLERNNNLALDDFEE